MYDGFFRAFQAFEGTPNEMFPCLRQHLNADVRGHVTVLDQFPGEFKFGWRGGGKAHLDLLETNFRE